MKTVFSSAAECIHVFAQQQQSNGRSSNVFFEYTTKLYSYGHHYLLAEFIKNNSGSQAVMINDRGYSSTTSKHISIVRGATRQYKQFYTMECSPKLVFNQLLHLSQKLNNARKPELYIKPANNLFASYNEFKVWNDNKIEDQDYDIKINEIIQVFNGKDYKEYLQSVADRLAEETKQRLIAAKKQLKENLKKFYNYEINYLYNNNTGIDYLRLSKDQTNVQTSQGVNIPIKEAVLLYKLIKAKKDIHGYNLHGYTVISINGTLKVGCHNIDRQSVTKIGEQILNIKIN